MKSLKDLVPGDKLYRAFEDEENWILGIYTVQNIYTSDGTLYIQSLPNEFYYNSRIAKKSCHNYGKLIVSSNPKELLLELAKCSDDITLVLNKLSEESILNN